MLTQCLAVENARQPLSLDRPLSLAKPTSNILLEAILEGWLDGVLVLTETGKWVQANDTARRLCAQLNPDQAPLNTVPAEIWRICQALIQSRETFPNQPVHLESEVRVNKSTVLRVRVRWFDLSESSRPYLLVILEDRYQSIQNMAIAEVDRFHLTPREAEVWLLHRANYSYKEIATELYISINTVKKHLKSANAKRQDALYFEQCCS